MSSIQERNVPYLRHIVSWQGDLAAKARRCGDEEMAARLQGYVKEAQGFLDVALAAAADAGRCPETDIVSIFEVLAQCERKPGHPGAHQDLHPDGDLPFGWTWGYGSGGSTNPTDFFCPTCGTRNVRSDPLRQRVDGDQCSACDYWDEQVEPYAAGTSFAYGGSLYSISAHGRGRSDQHGADVHFDDGRVVEDILFSGNVTIPAERRDVFPDNARIVWGWEKERAERHG